MPLLGLALPQFDLAPEILDALAERLALALQKLDPLAELLAHALSILTELESLPGERERGLAEEPGEVRAELAPWHGLAQEPGGQGGTPPGAFRERGCRGGHPGTQRLAIPDRARKSLGNG